MANTLPPSALIAKDTVAILKNNPGFVSTVNRSYESEFQNNTYDPGQTINIKRPPRYTVAAGRVATPQDTVITTIPLTVNQFHVPMYNTRIEATLLNNSWDRRIEAAATALITEVDRQCAETAKFSAFNIINAAGAAPTTQALAVAAATDVYARLDEMGAPQMDRFFCLAPKPHGNLVAGMAGMFNDQSTLSAQFRSGKLREALGFGFMSSQNVSRHTNGAATATNINGANQVGSAITVVAVAGGTLTRGTIITLPGVNAVNPQTRVDTGSLANFIVTADVAAGATSIPISPAIVTSGQFQNVTASPTTGAAYVIQGAASTSYSANIAYQRDFMTLAMVPMATPKAGSGAVAYQHSEDGITVKVTEYWDGNGDVANIRLDALFGMVCPYPELGVRFAVL
ncbi:MAG: P22 phage major capsid protein family protein [Candidatus Margulisiibacteriota bacterium]